MWNPFFIFDSNYTQTFCIFRLVSDLIYYYQNFTEELSRTDNEILPLVKITELTNGLFFHDISYNHISIPLKIHSLLNELCDYFQLSRLKKEFLTFLAYSQINYFEAKHHLQIERSIDEDFLNLPLDLDKLFSLIKDFMDSSNNNKIKSIYFKFKNEESILIENFFVIQDIYTAIRDYYKFSTENFDGRVAEILESNETAGLLNTSKFLRKSLIKFLYNFLINQDIPQSASLRFIGTFLHLAQIPTTTEDNVEIYDTLKLNLDSIEINNLRNHALRGFA